MIVLRPRPGAAPFATLRAHEIRATPLESGGLFVEAQTGGVRTRGYVNAKDALVYSAHPIKLGGVFTSTALTALHVTTEADGSLRAAPKDADKGPTGKVTCSDSTLAEASFETPNVPEKVSRGVWETAGDGSIPISAQPNGPPVAQLGVVSNVRMIERRGDRSHIEVANDDGIYNGWVPTSALHYVTDAVLAQRTALSQEMVNREAGVVMGASLNFLPQRVTWPRGPFTPPSVAATEELKCPGEVRLIADLLGRRTWVGTIAPRSTMRVVAREPSVASVSLATATGGAFVPARYGTLLVPARDLTGCAPRPITIDPRYNASRPSEAPPDPPNATELHGDVSVTSVSGDVANAEASAKDSLRRRASACYTESFERERPTRGQVVLRLEVHPEGDVASVKVDDSAGLSPSLVSCVATAARSAQFTGQAPQNRLPIAVITLSFSVQP